MEGGEDGGGRRIYEECVCVCEAIPGIVCLLLVEF